MKGRVMFVLSQASGVCGGIDSAAIRGKRRFAQGVYYNTTGICTAGIAQQRPKMLGYARFHQCGGFDPHHLRAWWVACLIAQNLAFGEQPTNFYFDVPWADLNCQIVFLWQSSRNLRQISGALETTLVALLHELDRNENESGATRRSLALRLRRQDVRHRRRISSRGRQLSFWASG
jgi:hypothetical protein